MSINKQEFLSGLGKFKTKQDIYNESVFAKKSDVVGGVTYKGSVMAFENLPASAQKLGDIYNVRTAGGKDAFNTPIKAGDNVAWNGTGWDNLGGEVDLSGYVEKDGDKVLSTNDFTDADKEKLGDIEEGAQVNAIEKIMLGGVSLAITNKTVNINTSNFVTKIDGKALSTNDFTDAYKTKLDDLVAETILQADIDALFTAGGGSDATTGGDEP
ncbi:MAG: hypothetical protein IJ774_05455 [Selenomonadaceae bacterium]|nr:hypothetical protein [Selenomonadaceae bacterium]MBR1805821.1 hypothetical protein [Selenomonadaceae bacterium]